MDNFEEKMNIIFNKNFETPSHYKSAVDKAINEAEYGCKKTNILHLYCFKNIAAGFLIGVITLSGIAYAGVKIYENIWKTPEEISINDFDVNTNEKNHIINESELKNIALNEFNKIGYDNITIEKSEYIKNPYSNTSICFQISAYNDTEKTLSLMLDATNGNFISFGSDLDIQAQNYRTSREEAKNIARILYKKLGFEEGSYDLTNIVANNKDNEIDSWFWTATFTKKYNNVINKYQSISISFIPEINKIIILQKIDYPFENNDIVLTKEEAIQIAKNKNLQLFNDNNYENKINIDCNLSIEKMNSTIYSLENNIEENFKFTNANGETVSGSKYFNQNIVRNVYLVKLSYENSNKIIEYFIDTTTGEIIGGNYFDF